VFILNFNNMTEREKEKALIPFILKVLQECGGQEYFSIIREKIIDSNDAIAQFANKIYVSKKTGNKYKKFDFRFNFAMKSLMVSNFLTYKRGNPSVVLTDKGMNVDINSLNIDEDVYSIADKYWKEKHEQSKLKKQTTDVDIFENDDESSNSNISEEEQYMESFKERLLSAISKMSPKKFEMFSRLLLSKMGVEFTNIGVKVSNDGGIDGYGYHRDLDDFRTTRVVIQCKRYNASDVGSPEIDRFLGAMNKFQADYGIFITNSRYTVAAQEAARAGTPITLIDGNDLVRLVIKYNLHIKPIQTYELLEFYDDEDATIE